MKRNLQVVLLHFSQMLRDGIERSPDVRGLDLVEFGPVLLLYAAADGEQSPAYVAVREYDGLP